MTANLLGESYLENITLHLHMTNSVYHIGAI